MTRNPTNSHIVDSGKGRNDLIAIPVKLRNTTTTKTTRMLTSRQTRVTGSVQ
ncbi:hypothetical protein J6590_062416, partial [Homalodisca vitripennis]